LIAKREQEQALKYTWNNCRDCSHHLITQRNYSANFRVEYRIPWNYQHTVQELETNAREKMDFKELTQREWDIRQKGFSNRKVKQFKKKFSQKNPESTIKPSLKRSKRACAETRL